MAFFLVRGVLGNTTAGEVHVRANIVLVREDPADFGNIVRQPLDRLAKRTAEVIGVGHGDRAFTGDNAAQLIGVAALRITGQSCPPLLLPSLSRPLHPGARSERP
jgi:hypothetical protein